MTRPADAVRLAVRTALTRLPTAGSVLVACSGGSDSVALVAAAAEVGPAVGLGVGAVIVDHGLQPGSAQVAQSAALTCVGLGLEPVVVRSVTVDGGGGPEAAARAARYEAITQVATDLGASAVLLGHTLDDQAETVLLALARGSGGRSLSGMPESRGIFRRPLLSLPRVTVRSAYPDLASHEDPHNEDPRFLRARVRHEVIPMLVEVLGPGVPAALARTAQFVSQDAQAVQVWADRLAAEHVRQHESGAWSVEVRPLGGVPRAVLVRLLRDVAGDAGADLGRMSSIHLSGLAALVDDWRGQGAVYLPGAVTAQRTSGRVVLTHQR